MANSKFRLVHARYVVIEEEFDVEFIGRYELRYGRSDRSIVFTVEPYVADDGAPDGVIVHRDDDPQWSNGNSLLDAEFTAIMLDLQKASVPLKTKFRWP